MAKREYRGQRSVDAIVGFIKEQLKDPIHHYASADEMEDFEASDVVFLGSCDDFTSHQAMETRFCCSCIFLIVYVFDF